MSASDVAAVIADQIGYRALTMIGAREICSMATGLKFRVMKNGAGITHLVVELDAGSDTYVVRFYRARNLAWKLVAEVTGAHAEDLCSLIREHTGLATSL